MNSSQEPAGQMWNIMKIDLKRQALFGTLVAEEIVQKCVGEVLGTAILLFLGCLGDGIAKYGQDNPLHYFVACFNFGLAVMATILVVGHISDCHINPVVTLTLVIVGLMKSGLAVLYIVCQFFGAILGYGLLYGVGSKFRGANSTSLCVTQLHEDVGVWEGVGIEAILTAILCFVVCSAFDPRNASKSDSTPIKFGLAVACLSLAGGTLTGCSMNPARSFGPSLWTANWKNHWVYWLGPFVGCIVAATFYRLVFYIPTKTEQDVTTKDSGGV